MNLFCFGVAAHWHCCQGYFFVFFFFTFLDLDIKMLIVMGGI